MLHGLVGIDSRTTRSNDGMARGKRAQHFIFHFDKAIRTACIDNLLQRLVELALNKQVGIDEFIAKDLRQARFASTLGATTSFTKMATKINANPTSKRLVITSPYNRTENSTPNTDSKLRSNAACEGLTYASETFWMPNAMIDANTMRKAI